MRLLPLALMTLAACAAAAPPNASFIGNAFEVLQNNPIKPDELIKVTPLHENADHTVSLVQVNGELRPHRHDAHDEIAFVLEGTGTFTLDGVARELKPGDVQVIPRGAVHSFVNKGPGATAVVSVFTPKFDGRDRIFIDGP